MRPAFDYDKRQKPTVLKVAAISAFALVLTTAYSVASEDGSDTRYETDSLRPLNMPPTFSNGYLAVYEPRAIGIYEASGALRCRIAEPPRSAIRNVAVDKDGTVATVVNTGHTEGNISVWDSGCTLLRVIEIPGYLPAYAAFAPDGSIWVTGRHAHVGPSKEDYFILRRISREGNVQGAYLKRSSFLLEKDPVELVTALRGIHIANERIGMYFSGGSSKEDVWVEADLKGKELGRWPMNSHRPPAAVTESGFVYSRSPEGVYVLDREGGKWLPVSVAALGSLVGAAGESLVFADVSRPHLYRVSLP